jgi:hypothetical protein
MPGRYQGKGCAAVAKEKDNMCKPVKIEKDDAKKKKGKKRDKKEKEMSTARSRVGWIIGPQSQ